MVSFIPKFKNRRILVVGDLMLDEYVWGSVDRISPEAPVQVVSVDKEDFTLGGAGNVVNNLRTLGAKVSVAGVAGDDAHGERLVARFAERGIDPAGIFIEEGRPTTRKTRIISANQHVLRIDRETRSDIAAETMDRLRGHLAEAVAGVDLVLVSDYGKGLVGRDLLSFLAYTAAAAGRIAIADPKGIDFSKYRGLSMITPNKKEAAAAAGLDLHEADVVDRSARRIMQATGIGSLLITCGNEGMVLFEKEKKPVHIHSRAKQVFDVSGAGDTVLAVLGLAMASGLSCGNAARLANTAAGIVVGKVGTATVTPDELIEALEKEEYSSKRKGTLKKHVTGS
jgi:rfaE bifunctional protein kinase chain/domain